MHPLVIENVLRGRTTARPPLVPGQALGGYWSVQEALGGVLEMSPGGLSEAPGGMLRAFWTVMNRLQGHVEPK